MRINDRVIITKGYYKSTNFFGKEKYTDISGIQGIIIKVLERHYDLQIILPNKKLKTIRISLNNVKYNVSYYRESKINKLLK